MNARLDWRILFDLREFPWSTWAQVERRLGIDGDIAGIVAAIDARDRLMRDRLLERFDPDGLASIYNLTEAGFERLMELMPSGEAPDVEIDDRRVVA